MLMDSMNNNQSANNIENNQQMNDVGGGRRVEVVGSNQQAGSFESSQEMGNIESNQQVGGLENKQQAEGIGGGQQLGDVESSQQIGNVGSSQQIWNVGDGQRAVGMDNQAAGNTESTWHKNRKLCYIVLGALAVIVGVGLVAMLMVGSGDGSGGSTGDNNNDDSSSGGVATGGGASETNRKPFMDLTKEEAVAAYLEMQKPNYIPEGYISDTAIPTNGCEKPQNLPLYSYANKDDVEGIYNDSTFVAMGALDRVEFVQDYYAVAFSVPYEYEATWAEDGTALGCLRAFSFNKQYYDYSEESSPNGAFIDASPEFIKVALPVLATFSGGTAQLSNIYSYDFEEDEDGITLNIHELGIGYDTDYSDLDTYREQLESGELTKALQFSTIKYRYDNSTNQADWVRDCDECVFGIKVERTIPLEEDEVEDLYINN